MLQGEFLRVGRSLLLSMFLLLLGVIASTHRRNSPPASSTSGPCPPPCGLGAPLPERSADLPRDGSNTGYIVAARGDDPGQLSTTHGSWPRRGRYFGSLSAQRPASSGAMNRRASVKTSRRDFLTLSLTAALGVLAAGQPARPVPTRGSAPLGKEIHASGYGQTDGDDF
jgi:hypothetical protein